MKNSIYKTWVKFGKPLKPQAIRIKNRIYYFRNQNPFVFMERHSRYNGVIIDGGAHDGGTIVTLKQYIPNATIHAFEPLTNLGLKKCIKHYDDIVINHVALGDYDGTSKFNVNCYDDTSSILNSLSEEDVYKTKETIDVPVMKLDSYVETKNIDKVDIIKLDVQGYELSVLKGAKETLDSTSIVFTEVWFKKHYNEQCSFFDIYDYLSSLDFEIFNIYSKQNNKKLTTCDVLFVKKGLA
jgi:FkbM family methyltransferase